MTKPTIKHSHRLSKRTESATVIGRWMKRLASLSPVLVATASALVGFAALTVTAAQFYFQWGYERADLSMEILDFSLTPDARGNPVCTIDIALFNIGNRDTALLDATLNLERRDLRSTEAHFTSKEFERKAANTRVSDRYVVKAGEIRFLRLTYQDCGPTSIRLAVKERKENLGIETQALDHTGQRHNVYFARTLVEDSGALKFSLHTFGKFNLLSNNTYIEGGDDDGATTLAFRSEGNNYTISKSFTGRTRRNW